VNGGIHNITIPEHSARLISLPGQQVHAPVVAVIQLNGFRTQPGQSLAITGSCPELGAWDHSRSYGMEYVNQNTWITEVPIVQSVGLAVHFKFLVHQNDQNPILENIVSRWVVMPQQGRVKLDCEWNND
jgi:cyclomaltodextrin glucanotransferase